MICFPQRSALWFYDHVVKLLSKWDVAQRPCCSAWPQRVWITMRNLIKCIHLSSYNLRNHEPQTDYIFSYYKSLMVLQIIEFLYIVPRLAVKIYSNATLFFLHTIVSHFYLTNFMRKIHFFMFLISLKELIYLQEKKKYNPFLY